jgi:uncharacterized protein (TIGR02246 family)
MKRILMILALAVTVSSLALGQTADKKSPTSKAEQEVLKINKEYNDAIARQDAAAYERLLADDLTFTTPDGQTMTKAQKISFAKSGDLKLESWQTDEVKARVYGDAAVVTGRYAAKGAYKGQAFSETGRSTTTYVKRNRRWQVVAGHTSMIAQQ